MSQDIETIRKVIASGYADIKSEMSTNREELNRNMRENREEIQKTLKDNREEQTNAFSRFEQSLRGALKEFSEKQNVNSENLKNKIDEKIKTLTDENSKKLDEMRAVVDEKLQATLEKRFNESFTIISEKLEAVHKGLGEMQNLGTSILDIKKVFSNVKTRGVLGEIQLASILEEILPVDTFIKNAQVKTGSAERVDYAVKLPGNSDDGKPVLLPIDSKFPVEDYLRLADGYEQGLSSEDLIALGKSFENSIKTCARSIRDKYINPPTTSDFAVLFVPTEGIYSEITRRPDLFYYLNNDLRILVTGPINIAAFLHSLLIGFKTLTIQKNSQEAWRVLGQAKSQFSKFGDILMQTKKKLTETINVIEKAEVRTRGIERSLKNVQEISPPDDSEIVFDAIEDDTE
jgi:DNA recombination protein RmuC